MIIALIGIALVFVLNIAEVIAICQDFENCRLTRDLLPYLVSILPMVIFAILLGPTRSNVQRITRVADGGCGNYVLGGCCSPFILSQEHRIIARKWRANNAQPLSSGVAIMPVATMSSAAVITGAE